jgi:hypothetical protein
MDKPRGLPPSRVGFPASLETAFYDCIRIFVLRRLHRHIAFRKPCGSFSVLELHQLHDSRNRQVKKESVSWFNTRVLLPRRAI